MEVPFSPELMSHMQNRIVDSLKEEQNVDNGYRNLDKRNVFDFWDGLRLIVSKDLIKAVSYIHVSATIEVKSLLADLSEYRLVQKKFVQLEITTRIEQLLGSVVVPIKPSKVTKKGVPHWFFVCKN